MTGSGRHRSILLVLVAMAALVSASMLAPAFGAPQAVSAVSLAKKLSRTLKIAKRADRNAKTALARAGTPGPAGPRGAVGPPGERGTAGTNGTNGAAGTSGQDAFTDVGVATSVGTFTTTSTSFVDVTGASTTITVPAGRTVTVVANFSAESTCTSTSANDWCSARILIGDVELNPQVGNDAAFDSPQDGNTFDAWEHNALVRSRTGVGAGTHTVKVQAAVRDNPAAGTMNFTLSYPSLAVQAIDEG